MTLRPLSTTTRARWIVEEYFKALKTGCSFEKRQLMSFEGLCRALAVFIPMAWGHLLLLRCRAQSESSAPVLTNEQSKILRALLARRSCELPRNASARDVLMGVAALGRTYQEQRRSRMARLGTWGGFTRFLEAEIVWNLAQKK